MRNSTRQVLRPLTMSPILKPATSTCTRTLATQARASKKEGDISSVFVSLSGASPTQLPERFAHIKQRLISGNEDRLKASWRRLLGQLSSEIEIVAKKGPDVIPQINFSDLEKPSSEFVSEVKKRGVAVIKGVVPEDEARAYKTEIEEYVKANPWTKAFPPHDPQVYELYWSHSQTRARAHPNLIATQRHLMSLWHTANPTTEISTSQPLTYADRVRIRQPGDAGFALGPHVDGGSVERWEPTGYGLGAVYDKIFQGNWEEYDPWESSCRIPVVSDLYEGGGACSMFRMFQGWLSMSKTGPGEGTLMVNPLLQLSTAYFLLRPFFAAVNQPKSLISGDYSAEFLDADNWRLEPRGEVTSELQGANPGHAQELNQVLHPHLDLRRSMVHVPKISPGDYVAWHCDTIHAVDNVHAGNTDSSVLYIPVCPTTESNLSYLAHQRDTFLSGFPGPDFPGGKGESEHFGRPTAEYLRENVGSEGLRAMGLERLSPMDWEETTGSRKVVEKGNEILGFD